jgi:diphthine-ammonia ligase
MLLVLLSVSRMRVAVNWSGGKDSVLACYNAVTQGYEISTLINFVFTDFTHSRPNPVKFSSVFKYMIQDHSSSSLYNTPHKIAMLSSLALREVTKYTPNQVATPVKYVFDTVGKHMPHQVSTIVGAVRINASRRMVPHEAQPELVAMQAQAMGVPILQIPLTWVEFEDKFKETIRNMNPKDVEGGVVWGMIPPDEVLDHSRKMKKFMNLEVQYDYIYKISDSVGVEAIMPLIGKTGDQILCELVDNNFEVLVSVVNPDFVDEKWLGHRIDQDFIAYMRKLNAEEGINLVGDEFHTFVADCPLFKKRINVIESKKVSKDGYSTLEISKAELVAKDGRS